MNVHQGREFGARRYVIEIKGDFVGAGPIRCFAGGHTMDEAITSAIRLLRAMRSGQKKSHKPRTKTRR